MIGNHLLTEGLGGAHTSRRRRAAAGLLTINQDCAEGRMREAMEATFGKDGARLLHLSKRYCQAFLCVCGMRVSSARIVSSE